MLGRTILVQSSNQALAEIVGVVGDVRHNGLTIDPVPTVFLLHAQTPGYITNLVVRTEGDPSAHAAAIRRAIHDADPAQAVSAAGTLDEDVAKVLARPRLQAILVASFAVIAVDPGRDWRLRPHRLRRHPADARDRNPPRTWRDDRRIFAELFSQGVRLVLAGLAFGLAAAAFLRQLVSTLVFGVTPGDPLTYVLAALGFLAVALTAVVIPARRGSHVEPVSALRCD